MEHLVGDEKSTKIRVTELEDKRPTVIPKHTGDNYTKMDDKKAGVY